MKNKILLICFLCGNFALSAQKIDITHPTYPHAKKSLDTFKELLAIPNDAHFPEDIEKNVVWCSQKLEKFGFTTERLSTPSVPLLLANYTKKVANKPTLLFYFHIDGQPTDASFWFQENPYQAVLKEEKEAEGWLEIDWNRLQDKQLNPEWRIYARSASDDKSPFVMFLAALSTIQKQGKDIPYNLKVVLDFEEEIGSPNLAKAVENYRSQLAADNLIIFDGPKHLNNQPTIAYGARGNTTMTIKVFGPTFPLHSGHYGNYAPNPAMRLCQLMATMKDEEGRVLIPGYYDGIDLDAKTKEILESVPDDERALQVKLGIGEVDKVGNSYQEALQFPSLNIRGMSSAWTGSEVRTIVPATATAELDLRLVVESDGLRLQGLVKKHIEDQGYFITENKPTSRERVQHKKICQIPNNKRVTKPFRTDFDSPLGIWVFETIKETFGNDPIRLRTMGGTLPTSPFINTLDVPAVIVPLVNSDNNQHSPNENVRLGNYFDGAKTIYGLLVSPLE